MYLRIKCLHSLDSLYLIPRKRRKKFQQNKRPEAIACWTRTMRLCFAVCDVSTRVFLRKHRPCSFAHKVCLRRVERNEDSGEKKKRKADRLVCFLFLAPPAGLEQCDKVCSLTLTAPRELLCNSLPCAPNGAQRVAKPQVQQKKQNEKRSPIGLRFRFGSPCWTRTSDTLINSQVLYRLS